MRTTVTIDDSLFEEATRTAGISNASELIKVALKKLVSSESRKRLIALGGSAPDFAVPGRSEPAPSRSEVPMSMVAEDTVVYGSKKK